jgi:hypothetical protein
MKVFIASVSPATAAPELTPQLDDGKQGIAKGSRCRRIITLPWPVLQQLLMVWLRYPTTSRA